jgi:hypothetical protein
MDVKPGSTVTIQIKAKPRSAAASKTLARVLRKDPSVATQKRRQKRLRPSLQQRRRGGRWWSHRMRSTAGVAMDPGCRYSVRATVDVIRDLESVSRWVEVSGG